MVYSRSLNSSTVLNTRDEKVHSTRKSCDAIACLGSQVLHGHFHSGRTSLHLKRSSSPTKTADRAHDSNAMALSLQYENCTRFDTDRLL